MFEKWLTVNSEIDNIVPITISQKVLECIALHRSVPLEQIIEYLQAQKPKYEHTILEKHQRDVGNPNPQFLDSRFLDFLPESQWKRENDVLKENITEAIDR